MIEKFEYKGLWWLPSKPRKAISGILKLIPGEGTVLELEGAFGDIHKVLEQKIILGTSSQGEPITLHECLNIRQFFAPVEFGDTSTFRVKLIIVGVHFRKPENIKFKNIAVHFSYLNEWFNIIGLADKACKVPNGIEVSIKCNLPHPVKVANIHNYNIYIVTKAPMSIIFQKEASIKLKTYIKIETLKETSFEKYLKIIQQIRNLLSLAIAKPVQILAIEATQKVMKTKIQSLPKYPPIEIFYQLTDIPQIPGVLAPFDMLFTFNEISNRFEKILSNWFGKATLLELIYTLYFSTLYNPLQYLEHQFLSLIYALESYHRIMMKNYELPREDHNERIEEILNVVPQKYKDWLKYKLEYSNEPTLRKRLKEILNKYSKIAAKFIENQKLFIDRIVKSRNYLLHGDLVLKQQAARGKELALITRKLKIFVELCLLTEIGFTVDEIENLISRNKRYKYLNVKDAVSLHDD